MIDQLPPGKNIGRMQAPPRWIFTHTARFAGIVRIVTEDGEGFILIRKGKPLVYYFRQDRIVLCGEEALEYFNSRPTIEFCLCRYSADELSRALKICNIDESPEEPETVQGAVPVAPAAETKEPPSPESPDKPSTGVPIAGIREPAGIEEADINLYEDSDSIPVSLDEPVMAEGPDPSLYEDPGFVPVPVKESVFEGEPEDALYEDSVPESSPIEKIHMPESQAISPPADPDDPDIRMIGQIRKLNGIVAVSVFSDDRDILLMGDTDREPLLKTGRSMLATAEKIMPCLDWGSFVHITLQVPDGNVIIAPYRENHLCILTTRTVNIGHIRRILRDLQHF